MSASDEEQIEAIKRWWRENGRSVVAGVVIAVAGVVGWQQWGAYQQNQAEQASSEYLAFLEGIAAEDTAEGALERGQALVDNYGGTPYAPLTAMWMASHYAEQGELESAEAQLRWALQNADSQAKRHIARLRLGRLLLAAERYDDALSVLRASGGDAFSSQYQELRGDIYKASGQRADAARAYRAALESPELGMQRRNFIELKLAEVGGEEPVS